MIIIVIVIIIIIIAYWMVLGAREDLRIAEREHGGL